MENKKPNLSFVELVEKLLNEAKKKKEKSKGKEKMADKDYDGDGKVETSKEEYFGSKDKAIKKAMGKKEIVSKDKKKQMNEGRVVGTDNIRYGGFPKVIKEGEESESLAKSSSSLHSELEKHIGTISSYGQQLHKSDNPNRYKFGKTLNAFMDGNYNHADELISMGADPTAVGTYIKIKTSPEYKEEMEKVKANISPESMGYGKPGSGSRYTGD